EEPPEEGHGVPHEHRPGAGGHPVDGPDVGDDREVGDDVESGSQQHRRTEGERNAEADPPSPPVGSVVRADPDGHPGRSGGGRRAEEPLPEPHQSPSVRTGRSARTRATFAAITVGRPPPPPPPSTSATTVKRGSPSGEKRIPANQPL